MRNAGEERVELKEIVQSIVSGVSYLNVLLKQRQNLRYSSSFHKIDRSLDTRFIIWLEPTVPYFLRCNKERFIIILVSFI